MKHSHIQLINTSCKGESYTVRANSRVGTVRKLATGEYVFYPANTPFLTADVMDEISRQLHEWNKVSRYMSETSEESGE